MGTFSSENMSQSDQGHRFQLPIRALSPALSQCEPRARDLDTGRTQSAWLDERTRARGPKEPVHGRAERDLQGEARKARINRTRRAHLRGCQCAAARAEVAHVG